MMLIKPSQQSAAPWKPHNYQKKAVVFLLEHACAGLFLDPGLGKTSITLKALATILKLGLIDKVLIIAPLRVCHSVWPAEIEKWSDFSHLKAVVLHGPNKEELLKSDANIFIINPEGVDWLLDVTKTRSDKTGKASVAINTKRWKALGFGALVVDELTKFKNTQSIRFKALKMVLPTFAYRWGLTGSPASNGLEDLYGQCYILDMGRALGTYVTNFRRQFFLPHPSGFGFLLQEGAEERIYKQISPLVLRMSASDHLDLPQLVENNIRIDLPPKVMDFYEKLEDDLIVKIGAHDLLGKGRKKEMTTFAATNTADMMNKCRQVASGGIYPTPEIAELIKRVVKKERDYVELHDAKTDALEDLIDELQGSPILVAYEFNHDLERIKKRFGNDIPLIGGGVSPTKSKQLEKQWNAGNLPFLFGHPASMGHGLNLQEAGCHVAWYTVPWDFELYDQLIRRVWRQGNTHRRVFVHHLIATGTIDELILDTLKEKDRTQQSLFTALKKLRRRGK